MAENIIIIGSGPAGLTAALYTARANLEPLCLEGANPGGQLTITTDVENFPGFPDTKTGPELIDRMHKQAERFGARFEYKNVEKIDLSKKPFVVDTGDDKLECHAMIIASGASARWLGIESEKKLQGRGVSACATCDGFFFKGKDVLVVGGGDSAMEEAIFLTRFCSKVSVIHRRGELRASKIMQERALKNDKIEFEWNSVITEVHDPEAGKVTGVTLKDTQTGETREKECQGVFMAIGHDPNTRFLNNQLDTNEAGFIECKDRTTHTSVEGVFAAGDVMDPRYKQAVTAAGTGCMAAIDAERYLESLQD
ncbi:MAG: thioredoxin-disulfide reductase [Candidatus Sumerlaeia bacterium]